MSGSEPDELYFAYGSNMLVARLRHPDRAPRALPLGQALLRGHRLAFHKRGRDGSGKADAAPCGDPAMQVHGVLYWISATCRLALDRIEGVGRGYRVARVELEAPSGERHEALTYIAEASYIQPELRPYIWYRDLVLAGALEHGLPPDYVRRIGDVEGVPDPIPERAARERRALPQSFPASRSSR